MDVQGWLKAKQQRWRLGLDLLFGRPCGEILTNLKQFSNKTLIKWQ